MHYWNSKQLIFDTSGKPLPNETAERLSTLLWEIIEEAFEFSAKANETDGGRVIPKEDSLYDFVSRRAREKLQDEQEQKTLIQMSEMWGAYVGEPVWKQSLRFAWMEECCGGGDWILAWDPNTHGTLTYGQMRCLSHQTILRSSIASQKRQERRQILCSERRSYPCERPRTGPRHSRSP